MKKVLFLLLILVGLLSVESCKKDQNPTAPDNGIENDSSLDVENRSYQEDACGNISKLCPTCELGTAITTKDLQAYVAGQSGSNDAKAYGIDKNILTIVVGTDEWVIHPAEFFKYESTELLVKHQGSQLLYSDTDLKIKKETNTVEIPIAVEMVKDLDQAAFKAGALTASAIKNVLGQDVIVTNEGNGNYRVIVNNTNTTTVTSERIWRDPCQGKSYTNTVEKVYNDVLGKNVTAFWSADIVNAALEKYLNNYEIIHSEKFDFRTDCVNTQQVVNYMLENDLSSVSPSDAPHIKLNYLGALLQLSDEEYDWFYADGLNTHFAEINKLYNQLSVDSPFFPSCTDCGRVMAEQALVGLFMDGTLTASNSTEITEIDNFFIKLECYDSDLYSYLYGKPVNAKSALAKLLINGDSYSILSALVSNTYQLQDIYGFDNFIVSKLLNNVPVGCDNACLSDIFFIISYGKDTPERQLLDLKEKFSECFGQPDFNGNYIDCNLADSYNFSITIYSDQPIENSRSPYAGSLIKGLSSGHNFIKLTTDYKINKNIVFGFYPLGDTNMNQKEYDSGIYDDSERKYSVSITKELTCDQFNVILVSAINIATTKKYHVFDYNCTNFALDLGNIANLNLPVTKAPIMFNGKYYGSANNAGDLGEDIRISQVGVSDLGGGMSPPSNCD